MTLLVFEIAAKTGAASEKALLQDAEQWLGPFTFAGQSFTNEDEPGWNDDETDCAAVGPAGNSTP